MLSSDVVTLLAVRAADVETGGPGEDPGKKMLQGQKGQGLVLGSPTYYLCDFGQVP